MGNMSCSDCILCLPLAWKFKNRNYGHLCYGMPCSCGMSHPLLLFDIGLVIYSVLVAKHYLSLQTHDDNLVFFIDSSSTVDHLSWLIQYAIVPPSCSWSSYNSFSQIMDFHQSWCCHRSLWLNFHLDFTHLASFQATQVASSSVIDVSGMIISLLHVTSSLCASTCVPNILSIYKGDLMTININFGLWLLYDGFLGNILNWCL